MKLYEEGFDTVRFIVNYLVCVVVVFGTAEMSVQSAVGRSAGSEAFTIGVLVAAAIWLAITIVRRLRVLRVPPINAAWLTALHVIAPALSALPASGLASQFGGGLMMATAASGFCLIVYPFVSKPG